MNIKLKIKFQGILPEQLKNILEEITKLIRVTIEGPSKADVVVKMTLNKDDGTFEGTIKVKAKPGTNNAVFVKGQHHLRKKICKSAGNTDGAKGENCGTGQIKLVAGENVIDATGMTMLAGDVSPQDGVVDAFDLSVVRGRIGKKDRDSLVIADLNSDGIVDTQDLSLVVQSLNYKFDDEMRFGGKSGQGQGSLLDNF